MELRKYPPTPTAARRMLWMARSISAVAFLVGLYLAVRSAAEGHTILALLFLATSLAYVLVTWVNPLSPLLWVAIAAMVIVLVVLEPNVISITLAVAASVLFWMRGRKQSARIDATSLRPVSPESVMPGAERFVTELIELGWRQAGAYAFDSPSSPVTASVLVHPDLDRHAEITDMVFGIESRFEGSRILITMSSGRTELPPNYLANAVLGASPAGVADAHQQGLDILATFGLTPLLIDERTIVSEALASEVETIEWSHENPTGGLFNFGVGVGALDESREAEDRIRAWLGVAEVAE